MVGGRPRKPGGCDPVVGVRLGVATIRKIDAYAKRANIFRSDAIRELLEAGLRAQPRPRAQVAERDD
jgi:hypothetical protein